LNKFLIPDQTIATIFEMDIMALKENGIKAIVFDLEETVVSNLYQEPNLKLQQLLKNLNEEGFQLLLVTNQWKKPVLQKVSANLNLKIFYFICKPFPWFIRHLIKNKLKLRCAQVAIVGDQLFVDTFVAKWLECTAIKVAPIKKTTSLYDLFLRPFEAKWVG